MVHFKQTTTISTQDLICRRIRELRDKGMDLFEASKRVCRFYLRDDSREVVLAAVNAAVKANKVDGRRFPK